MADTPLAVRAAAELELRRRNRERWWADPVVYARDRFAIELTPDQAAALRSVRDNLNTYVRAANGVGKTHLASVAVCWFMECAPRTITVAGTEEPTEPIVYTSAPVFSQVKNLLWKEIRARRRDADNHGAPLPGEFLPKYPRWELSETSFALGLSVDDEDSFKGQHAPYLLIVLDEGPGCEPWVYHAARTMLKGARARLLTIGNPTQLSGPFYDAFHSKSAVNSTLSIPAHTHKNVVAGLAHLGLTWDEWCAAPYDTHPLPVDFDEPIPGAVSLVDLDVAKIEFGVGSPLWKVVVEGDFPPSGNRNVIQLPWVEHARRGDLTSDDALHLPEGLEVPAGRYAGLDVARFGDDLNVLWLMDGRSCVAAHTWHGAELSDTTGRAIDLALRHGYHLNVDTGAMGPGVISHLKEAGFVEHRDFSEVAFGSGPTRSQDRYVTRRDQLWWELSDFLRCGAVDLSALTLEQGRTVAGELLGVEYEFDSRGRRKVEPKEKVKKRLGRSPNLADAFALALHRPRRTIELDTRSHAGDTITGGIMEELW